jgi:hypothetical protein
MTIEQTNYALSRILTFTKERDVVIFYFNSLTTLLFGIYRT